MTKQELYDKIVGGLRQQGKKSFKQRTIGIAVNDMICAYRGDNNCRCAFGFVIPDDLYSSRMEGSSVIGVLAEFPTLEAHLNLDAETKLLAMRLQHVHDVINPLAWDNAFVVIADDFGLEYKQHGL